MSNEDNMLDDSELCRRTEEHIKEINEKNRKMAEEIYDEVMEYRKRKKKEIILSGDDSEIYETLKNYEDELNEYIDNLIENSEEKFKELHKHELNEGIKKDEIILQVDGAGSNELLKKHAQNRKNFDEKLLSYMEEYEENNIEMEFGEWIELKLLDLI